MNTIALTNELNRIESELKCLSPTDEEYANLISLYSDLSKDVATIEEKNSQIVIEEKRKEGETIGRICDAVVKIVDIAAKSYLIIWGVEATFKFELEGVVTSGIGKTLLSRIVKI